MRIARPISGAAVCLLALTFPAFTPILLAQDPPGSTGLRALPPVRVELSAPAVPTSTSSVPVQLRLLDVNGKPIYASEPMSFKINATDAHVDASQITIQKGSSSATLNVKKDKAGLAHIDVAQTGSRGAALSGGTELSFGADEEFVPKRPYTILFAIMPSPKLLTGGQSGTIVARMIDADNREFPARQEYKIAFPELMTRARIQPRVMKISRNSSFAVAQISSDEAASLPFHPSIQPFMLFHSSTEVVDFVSPIVSAVVIPDHTYSEGTFPRKIRISVGLADARNNWIASDQNRTLVLKAVPESEGIFESNQILIPKGVSVVQTFFTPLREGKVTITAVSGGLQSPEMSIEFRYKIWFFLILAITGGFLGGIVKRALEGQKQIKELWVGALVGTFTGALAYLLAPVLDFKSAVPTIQAGSKLFQAFVYGFLGGALGFLIFRSLISGAKKVFG